MKQYLRIAGFPTGEFSQCLGRTGDSPVPSGDSPDGTAATVRADGDGLFRRSLFAVPVGESPTRAGRVARTTHFFMIELLSYLLSWFTPQTPVRRYRVTPRRNPSSFRREILAGVIHTLKHDSARATHG